MGAVEEGDDDQRGIDIDFIAGAYIGKEKASCYSRGYGCRGKVVS
jgi:hypothetical protein